MKTTSFSLPFFLKFFVVKIFPNNFIKSKKKTNCRKIFNFRISNSQTQANSATEKAEFNKKTSIIFYLPLAPS
jgi:hypothetical protein